LGLGSGWPESRRLDIGLWTKCPVGGITAPDQNQQNDHQQDGSKWNASFGFPLRLTNRVEQFPIIPGQRVKHHIIVFHTRLLSLERWDIDTRLNEFLGWRCEGMMYHAPIMTRLVDVGAGYIMPI
jgi:hypothetical protein